MPQWLNDIQWAAASLGDWLTACVVSIVAFAVMITALRVAGTRLRHHAASHASPLAGAMAELIGRSNWILVGLAAIILGVSVSGLRSSGAAHLARFWLILAAVQLALWADRAAALGLLQNLTLTGKVNVVTGALLSLLLRTAVWGGTILAVLDNLGVNITAMIAGLAIGGVAAALALQTVLSDLFASIAIGLDKPFEVGDFIVFGQVAGSIEYIGLKATRIRTLGGEQIVCSNTDLLRQTKQNYKRMQRRRIVFGFKVAYDIPTDGVEALSTAIRKQVEAFPDTRFDRAYFARLGDNRLEFEVAYYVMSADYNRYMDVQQAINLGIARDVGTADIAFALPERRLHFADGLGLIEKTPKNEEQLPQSQP